MIKTLAKPLSVILSTLIVSGCDAKAPPPNEIHWCSAFLNAFTDYKWEMYEKSKEISQPTSATEALLSRLVSMTSRLSYMSTETDAAAHITETRKIDQMLNDGFSFEILVPLSVSPPAYEDALMECVGLFEKLEVEGYFDTELYETLETSALRSAHIRFMK